MGQVTVYLDDQTEMQMNAAVKASGESKSKWVARVIREKSGAEWPQEVKAIAGTWTDFPTVEIIRQSSARDSERESF